MHLTIADRILNEEDYEEEVAYQLIRLELTIAHDAIEKHYTNISNGKKGLPEPMLDYYKSRQSEIIERLS